MAEDNNNICVIEDNQSVRKLFSTVLKKTGYQTIDFNDGNTAMEWLKDNSPACIIVDILLPDINGSEVLNYVRQQEHGDNIPIIAVTGFAKSNDREKYLNQGFDHYIAKPINTLTFADEVVQTIKQKNN